MNLRLSAFLCVAVLLLAPAVVRGEEAAPAVKAPEAAPAAKAPAAKAKDTTPPRGRMIVPHTKESPRNGEGTFLTLAGGELAYVYGAFTGMGDTDRSRLGVIRSKDGGDTWSEPAILMEDAGVSLLHPSLVRLAGGGIGLGYSKLTNSTKAVKVFRYSKDEMKTWSDEIPISDGSYGYMTGAHDRMLLVGGKRIVNTVHAKIPGGAKGRALGTFVFTSDDEGLTWQKRPAELLRAPAPEGSQGEGGFYETSIAEAPGGELLQVGRTNTGYMFESRSKDAGTTWSAPEKTTVLNPVAPARVTRVPGSDALVLLRNWDPNLKPGAHGSRTTLVLQVSRDGGRTWTEPRIIEKTGASRFDYPCAYWTGDTLHVAYRAFIRGCDVYYQRFTKAEVLEAPQAK